MQVHKKTKKSNFGHRIKFPLSSEQCEVLLAFEEAGNLSKLSLILKRDLSVVSRQIQKISQLVPVLEKQKGQWKLTLIGSEVCAWFRDASLHLSQITNKKTSIRIGATREFSTRVLCRKLKDLIDVEKNEISLYSFEHGVEFALLNGAIDFGFDCGRPNDPLIKYHAILPEEFKIVCSPNFLKKSLKITSIEHLLQFPHLEYTRIKTSQYLGLNSNIPNVLMRFNDLSTLREASTQSLGWSILPKYCVEDEIKEKKLIQLLPNLKLKSDFFGVWWLRENKSLIQFIENAENWLRNQKI